MNKELARMVRGGTSGPSIGVLFSSEPWRWLTIRLWARPTESFWWYAFPRNEEGHIRKDAPMFQGNLVSENKQESGMMFTRDNEHGEVQYYGILHPFDGELYLRMEHHHQEEGMKR